jgi:predicted secreted protein
MTDVEQLGGKFLLYVNTSGNDATPTWTKVGGQRKGKFGRKRDVVKAQHKDSFPDFRKVRGYREKIFDFDGVWITDSDTGVQDAGLKQLQYCDDFDEDAYVQIVTPIESQPAGMGSTYTGWVVVGELDIDGPHDNVITYTGKLEFNGPVTFDE